MPYLHRYQMDDHLAVLLLFHLKVWNDSHSLFGMSDQFMHLSKLENLIQCQLYNSQNILQHPSVHIILIME
jgi:hypothetical protein